MAILNVLIEKTQYDYTEPTLMISGNLRVLFLLSALHTENQMFLSEIVINRLRYAGNLS